MASIRRRAFVAIGLFVGFYALAALVVATLVAVPYAASGFLHNANARIADRFGPHRSPMTRALERIADRVLFGACFFSAGTLLWAIVPRPDRFEPPGTPLNERSAPALFAIIRDIAAATGQKMPAEVYLLDTVNASVTYRGGVMAFGSRPVLTLGLPLMLALPVGELKAVLAHEFGHYAGGDLKMTAWIYKTRVTILRAWNTLGQSIFAVVVHHYWRIWLLHTRALSREQELRADELSARVVHPELAASALRRISRISHGFNLYWQSEVAPLLEAGFLPPIASGFAEYLANPHIARRLDAMAAEDESQASDYASHPSVAERLAALEAVRADMPPPRDDRLAATLIGDPDFQARRLVARAVGPDASARLRRIDWSQVAVEVFAKQWREEAAASAAFLTRFTVDTIPATLEAFTAAGHVLMPEAPDDHARARAHRMLSVALAVVLLDAGAIPETRPGRTFVLRRGGDAIDPFSAVYARTSGEMADAEWQVQCDRFGITGRPLHSTPGVTPSTFPISALPTLART